MPPGAPVRGNAPARAMLWMPLAPGKKRRPSFHRIEAAKDAKDHEDDESSEIRQRAHRPRERRGLPRGLRARRRGGAHPLRVPPLHSAPRGRRRRERAARRRAARRALHAEALPRARQVGAPLQPGDARPQLHQVRARPRKGRPGVGVRQARRVRAAARPGGRRARGHREEHLLARGARHRWRRLKCRS